MIEDRFTVCKVSEKVVINSCFRCLSMSINESSSSSKILSSIL